MKTFILLLLVAAHAVAAEPLPPTAMQELAGVYKQRFKNGLVDGSSYESENIVEIVAHDATHLYIRAELQFYNGHSCSISGLARQENDAYVYHAAAPDAAGGPNCTLTIRQTKGALTFTDRLTADGPATCSDHCGMRGSLSNFSIPMKTRRPIRYMDRLIKSPQYQSAIKELSKDAK